MTWLDAIRALGNIGAELQQIRVQLTRLADHAEGKTKPEPLPELPDEPAEIAPARTDAEFTRIFEIENRYLATAQRLPTAEEICRELDGEEIPEDVSEAAMQKRLRVPE